MNKRVIYSGFNNERLFIMDYLKEKHGWEPVFISATEILRKRVDENYPDAIFLEEMSIRRACFDYSRIGPPVPIDAKIIEALSKYELSCLSLVEDTTGWNFSFYERLRYYYDLLKYWNTVIHRLKPDIYLNITWPHTVTDYTFYLLCKYYYSIPTIFIDPSPLFEGCYHVASTSLEDRTSAFKDIYNSGQTCDFHSEIKEYLNCLKSKQGKNPEYIRSSYEKFKKYEKFQYKDFLKHILLMFLGRAFKSANVAFKCNRQPFESPKSQMNRFQYFWFKDRLRRNNRKLRNIYASFVRNPDMNKKYIYFAAPYQPEASNCPSAGVYEDVFLILDILSASIPDDWVIYYKEHSAIFSGNLKGPLSRDRHFYQKVASYKNVAMIPADTDTFELIDNSQAVATAAGTVGWEAAVRGKPSLFFADVWYQGCKSLFRINTYQDCIDAIEKIRNGYKPDPKDIERYAAAIQQVAEKNLIYHNFYESIKKCPDPKFEMERIGKLFYEVYERHYMS